MTEQNASTPAHGQTHASAQTAPGGRPAAAPAPAARKTPGLSANALKLIAIAAMTLDHVLWAVWPGYDNGPVVLLLHCIGRLTMPIMCFFVAEGCHYTHDRKKYALRLFAFALVSHFAYCFAFGIPFLPLSTGVFNQTSVLWAYAWAVVACAVAGVSSAGGGSLNVSAASNGSTSSGSSVVSSSSASSASNGSSISTSSGANPAGPCPRACSSSGAASPDEPLRPESALAPQGQKRALPGWAVAVAVAVICAITFPSDWSCIAVMVILGFASHRGDFRRQVLELVLWVGMYTVIYCIFIDVAYGLVQMAVVLALPLLRLYNGQRGRRLTGVGGWVQKWFFYLYYPLHLLLVGLLRLWLHGDVGLLLGGM